MALIKSGTLEETMTADGTTVDTYQFPGGRGIVALSGDFGGGTFIADVSFDGGATWYGITDQSGAIKTFTSDAYGEFSFDNVCQIRGRLTGAVAPDLRVRIYR